MIRAALKIAGNRISENDWSGISLTQGLGDHNSFEVVMAQGTERGALKAKAETWMGKSISIGFEHAQDMKIDSSNITELFKGVVTSVGYTRRSGASELVGRGESPTILMDDGPNMRSFTDSHLDEIVDKALGEYVDANSSLFPNGPQISPENASGALPYTVQYGETAFDFVNRLAGTFGEWFYYDGMNLVFGKRPNGEPIDLDFGASELLSFDYSVRLVPSKFQVSAYDYTQNEQIEEPSPNDVKTNEVGKVAVGASDDVYSLEPNQFIEQQMSSSDVKALAQRRKDVAVDEIVEFTGMTRNAKLRLGQIISITDNESGDKHGDFIVVHLDHRIGQGGDYSNNFRAIPDGTPPPLTSMPMRPHCGNQVAKVVDVADEDGLGRIKVEFDWQKGTGETSPWIRVHTSYVGKDKGFYMVPEVEDRVVIGFESGNAEKPYMLGGFYDKEAKPEWFDKENRYKGFKSVGKNELRFDDKAQNIELHAPNEMHLSAGNRLHLKTGFKGEVGDEDSEIMIDAANGTVIIKAKIVNVEVADEVNVNCFKVIKLEAGESLEAKSSQIIKAEAGQDLEMKAMNIKSEASVKSESKGAQVAIGGQSMVEVKGAVIKLN